MHDSADCDVQSVKKHAAPVLNVAVSSNVGGCTCVGNVDAERCDSGGAVATAISKKKQYAGVVRNSCSVENMLGSCSRNTFI